MGQVGIIQPNAKVELIEGEILQLDPTSKRHNAYVDRLAACFFAGVQG